MAIGHKGPGVDASMTREVSLLYQSRPLFTKRPPAALRRAFQQFQRLSHIGQVLPLHCDDRIASGQLGFKHLYPCLKG